MPSCRLPFLRVCYPIFSRILCAMNSSPCRSSRRPRCATKAACRLPTSRAPAPIAVERSARPQPAADAPTPAPEAVRVPAVADCTRPAPSVRSRTLLLCLRFPVTERLQRCFHFFRPRHAQQRGVLQDRNSLVGNIKSHRRRGHGLRTDRGIQLHGDEHHQHDARLLQQPVKTGL